MSVGAAWAANAAEVQKVAASSRPKGRPACKGEQLWECVKCALLGMHGSSLIIFDWDDTLFPTTALAAWHYLLIQKSSTEAESQALDLPDGFPVDALAACAAAAIRALRAAKQIGNPIVVTNSDHGWVHDCISRFVPSMSDEFRDIPVVSARSIFEPLGADAKSWKVLCYQRIVQCFHSGPAGIFGVRSLVSLGDSYDERLAAVQVATHCPCYVKSYKLVDRPNMSQLTRELDFLASQLVPIAMYSGNLDVDLGKSGPVNAAAQDLSTVPTKDKSPAEKVCKEACASVIQSASSKATTTDAQEPLRKRQRVASRIGGA